MRYSPTQYATVLLDLMDETPVHKRREVIREFLEAIRKNNSLSLIPDISRELEALQDKKAGLHHVIISTPERLLEGAVARKLHVKAKVTALRDVRLQGGATVEMGDLRVDNSIKMRLERAREAFTK